MAPGPLPDASALNTPGALETTAKVRELDRTLPKIDSTEALEAPATSYGTIALICPAPAYSIGAGEPLHVTCTVARVVSMNPFLSMVAPTPVTGPSELPNMVTISPGEMPPCRELAAFTTESI